MNRYTKTMCINGELQVGDLVISSPIDDYPCLIGRVLEINLLGSPEHAAETENDTDSVHVSFLDYDYSDARIKEIERHFSELYCCEKEFADCPLDDTIMAPDSLLRISGIDEKLLDTLLDSGYNAACYCYKLISEAVAQAAVTGESELLDDTDEIKQDIFDTMETALALAGYDVMDGDGESFIIRHNKSDTDYEIKVTEIAC